MLIITMRIEMGENVMVVSSSEVLQLLEVL